jgi:hypothetical protein
MEIELTLTGNPWSDLGIVSFCQELIDGNPPFLDGAPVWTEHSVIVCFHDAAPREDLEAWFADMLQSRWNQLYWPSRAAKALGQRLVFDKEGFVDTSKSLLLTKEQKEQVKEKVGTAIQLKDETRVAQTRLTYIGVPKDERTLRAELKSIVAEFIASCITTQDASKTCDLCGRASDALHPMTQSVNPLFNKHHNSKVRGAMGSNGYFDVCPVCRLTNLFATLETSVPFVYQSSERETSLILPDIPDLDLLNRVTQRLDRNLLDLNRPDAFHTSSNLREWWARDEWSLALVVFHNIFYEFSVSSQGEHDGEWNWNPVFDEKRDVPRLTRWLILPFAKPQNVRFGNIHVVEIDHRLYDFIKPIRFNDETDLRLVPDVLSCIRPRRADQIDLTRRLSRAIATSDTAVMNDALFGLWKHVGDVFVSPRAGRPHTLRLLPHFIQHFLEVNDVLDRQLREDLRALGHTIGSVFSRDVTLVSKIYNASSESTFREVLNQALFRLYKVGLSGERTDEELLSVRVQGDTKKVTRVSGERITRLLDNLSPNNWKEMAETLSTFVCLSAFNANFPQSAAAESTKGGNEQ